MDVDDKCAGGCGDDDSVSEGALDTGCSSYLFIPLNYPANILEKAG